MKITYRMIDRRSPELSDESLRSVAPSVFATQPLPGVSHRYAFVPTAELVQKLRETGWAPVSAVEQRVRLEGRQGYQKHLVFFQHRDLRPVQAEYTAELCLMNSHDRSSAYELSAGLFRFVSSNGLHVSDGSLQKMTVRHAGFTPQEVVEASFQILDQIPAVIERVERFRNRILTPAEANALAVAALQLRYQSIDAAPIRAEQLLESRRYEDAGSDLWKTLNRVQEGLLRGGQRAHSNARRMRAITGLDRNVEINRALWRLAQRLAAGEDFSFN